MTIRILPLAAAILLGGCVTYSYHQADGGGDYYYGEPQSQYGYVVPYAYPYGYGYGYGGYGGYYGGYGYGYYGYHGSPYSPYWYNPYYYGAYGHHYGGNPYWHGGHHHYTPPPIPPTTPTPRPGRQIVPLDNPNDGVAWHGYRRARQIDPPQSLGGGQPADGIRPPMPGIMPMPQPRRTTSPPPPPRVRTVTAPPPPPPSFSAPPPPAPTGSHPRLYRTERATSRSGDPSDR